MKKAVLALVATVIAGWIGIYLGAAMNIEGYLGNVFAIAIMGAFIISAIENKQDK